MISSAFWRRETLLMAKPRLTLHNWGPSMADYESWRTPKWATFLDFSNFFLTFLP